tara:strand:+ start:934 stop:1149 length:216 start_codon:yes stop_codon:yes gene_type:complete
MYDLIVYQVYINEVEDFIEDYFRYPDNIFRNIDLEEGDELGEVIIRTSDYDTSEDLEFALGSEGFLFDTLG